MELMGIIYLLILMKLKKKIIFLKSFFCEFNASEVYSHEEIMGSIDIEILLGRYKYFNKQTYSTKVINRSYSQTL